MRNINEVIPYHFNVKAEYFILKDGRDMKR